MSVLLDTCVLSELRRHGGNARVCEAVQALPDSGIFLNVLTIGEIVNGITRLNSGPKKQALQQWVLGLEAEFADHILPVDVPTSQLWGEITAQAQAHGITIPAVDGLIAATARRHGLNLMTRNVTDFAATGVAVINPWAD